MREFKRRRTRGAEFLRVGLGSAGVLGLMFLAFVAVRATWDMYGKFSEAAVARASAESQVAELESRYEKVKTDVEDFSTERGVEAALRERYGVAKPGEGAIAIVRTASSSEAVRQEGGFFDWLWQLLFVW